MILFWENNSPYDSAFNPMKQAGSEKINRMERALVVGTCVVPQDGGRPKTMRMFAKALNCPIASFTADSVGQAQKNAFEEVVHVPTSKKRWLGGYGFAAKQDRFDIEHLAKQAELLSCHVMLRYHANWVQRMARCHEVPYWFVPHGQLDPYVFTYGRLAKNLWMRLFGRRLLDGARHVIFATEKERLKARWAYDGPNARVIHWPVELLDVEKKTEAGLALRNRLKLSAKDRILLYFGRVHAMKRPLETIRAFAEANVPDLHLAIVGPEEGVTAESCLALAKHCGIRGKVHVPGPVYGTEKEIFLLGADGYISLSIRENFNHTAAESLAAGNPVILSPGNDLSGELENLDCGWMLKSDAPSEAIAAISAFATADKNRLEKMGENGRSFVASECSFDVFKKKLMNLKLEAIRKQ